MTISKPCCQLIKTVNHVAGEDLLQAGMADGESSSPPPRTPSNDTPTDEEVPREPAGDQKIIEVGLVSKLSYKEN